MSQRQDIHEQITNRIIEAIEKGAGEFKLPWHRPAGSIARPTNIQSKKGYRGINVVTLWVEAQIKGYAVPVWGTEARTPAWAKTDFKWRQLELFSR